MADEPHSLQRGDSLLLSNVGLSGLQSSQFTIVLCVERSQLCAQPKCRFGSERIQNTEAMTQVVRREIVESTSAVRLTGPLASV